MAKKNHYILIHNLLGTNKRLQSISKLLQDHREGKWSSQKRSRINNELHNINEILVQLHQRAV